MMTGSARLGRPLLSVLAAWSVLCALASQIRFPHFLFICEQVEALYHGMADDKTVYHVMQLLVAFIWSLGMVALVLGARIVGTTRNKGGT